MRYLGGKSRIASWVTGELAKHYKGEPYFEPFVGAAWVISRFTQPTARIANDINGDLIALFRALSAGWEPPFSISESEYLDLRHREPSALRAFAGFGCSWGGKWFGGYARSGARNYAANARNSLLKQRAGLAGIAWHAKDYREFSPASHFVYVDPPYAGTTAYSEPFDSAAFWEVMRVWSANNTVIVSEYAAPADFICIASFPRLQDIRFADGTRHTVVEKLFRYNPASTTQ